MLHVAENIEGKDTGEIAKATLTAKAGAPSVGLSRSEITYLDSIALLERRFSFRGLLVTFVELAHNHVNFRNKHSIESWCTVLFYLRPRRLGLRP